MLGKEAVPLPYESVGQKIIAKYPELSKLKTAKNTLFYESNSGLHTITSANALFGYLNQKAEVHWKESIGCYSKSEFFEFITSGNTFLPSYDAMFDMPHFPPLPNCYYTKFDILPKDTALDELIDKFSLFKEEYYYLAKAMFMTPFWGGESGLRPAFCLLSDKDDEKQGRGIGKTKMSEVLGRLTKSDYLEIDLSINENDARKRFLTAKNKRLARIDNIKEKVSNSFIESAITAEKIGGHLMYGGDADILNIFTWIFTVNSPEVSQDLAERSIPIVLKRPINAEKRWLTRTLAFVDKHRQQIISDVYHSFDFTDKAPDIDTRFESWWSQVMFGACNGNVDIFNSCNETVNTDKNDMNADAQRLATLEASIADYLGKYKRIGADNDYYYFDPETEAVYIKKDTAREIVKIAYGSNKLTNYYVDKMVRQMRSKNLHPLDKKFRSGYYWLWCNEKNLGLSAYKINELAEKCSGNLDVPRKKTIACLGSESAETI
jgi:hypothetical protein